MVRNVTVNPPPVVVCSGTDQVITNAVNVRGSILEIGGGPSNGGIAIQISQSTTTIVPLSSAFSSTSENASGACLVQVAQLQEP